MSVSIYTITHVPFTPPEDSVYIPFKSVMPSMMTMDTLGMTQVIIYLSRTHITVS